MRGQTNVILAIVVVIIVAVFAVINVDAVDVHYLFWTGHSPLIFVILFSVLMGCVITAAVGAVRMFRLQRKMRQLEKQSKKVEQFIQKKHLEKELETYLHDETSKADTQQETNKKTSQ